MARLAQSVERKALNLVVVGSSPTVGVFESLCANIVWTVWRSYEAGEAKYGSSRKEKLF